MLQAYVTARSARPIAAILIMGSLMGFVAGQRLGHPAPIAHRPVAQTTTVHASGGLGTPVAQPLSAARPAATASPDHKGKHDKHGKQDENGGGNQSSPFGGTGGDGGGGGGGD